MSCYMKIGHYTEADVGFPCDACVSDAMKTFRLNAKCVTITHKGAGIRPAIDAKVKELGGREFICNYSNRVKPEVQLTIYYR